MKNIFSYMIAIIYVIGMAMGNLGFAGGFTLTNKTNDVIKFRHIDQWSNELKPGPQGLFTHYSDYRANIYEVKLLPGKSFNIDKVGVWYDVTFTSDTDNARYAFKGSKGELLKLKGVDIPGFHAPHNQHWHVDIVPAQ